MGRQGGGSLAPARRKLARLGWFSALMQLAWLAPGHSWALSLDSSIADSTSRRDDGQANRPPPGVAPVPKPVFAEADRVEGRTERDVSLKGDAVVRRNGMVIRGDRITYYEPEDEVYVVGNARIVREGNVFVGTQLRLKLDTNEGEFSDPHFSLPAYKGVGAAEKVEFLGKNRFRFVNGYYTTCQGDHPAWCLRAESITLDEEAGEGRARSAGLYFRDTKVLGLPVFFFPLGEERKSGFLAPTFGMSSTTGFEMAMPYYWNMAPNYDLTLTPRLMTKRGLMLGSEFRYLSDTQFGTLRYDKVLSDREMGGAQRYNWNWQHTTTNFANWRLGVNAQGVSDDNYFLDFPRTVLNAAIVNLPREVTAMRSFGAWAFTARVLRFQNLYSAGAGAQPEKLPQFLLTRNFLDVNGFDANIMADLTYFGNPAVNTAAGWRGVFYPQISYPIQRSGWFVTPKMGWHNSVYELDRNGTNGSTATDLTRSVPIFSLDAGMVFDREATFFGRNMTQTLEPRLFYVRSPYRDQSSFPVFDTWLPTPNFGQLFSPNRFLGQDRIADQNAVTAALVSRLIEPATGVERFRFALGEKLYISPQQVQLPGWTTTSLTASPATYTDPRADILGAVTANMENHWSFDGGLQYSVSNKQFASVSLATRFNPPDGRIFNIAARYQLEQIMQLDTSWRWPLADRWMTMGRLNYSFLTYGLDPTTNTLGPLTRGMVQSVAGFEYTADCWVLRMVAQRYAASPTTYRTALFFQIELSGLGRIGNDPFDILRRNIMGYRPPSVRGDSPSSYIGYE